MSRNHFEEARQAIDNFLADDSNIEKTDQAGLMMAAAIAAGGKIITCGNGGSMCDAMHFAEELTGRYRSDRKALPAISISNPAHLSCVANDYGYEAVFSRFVEALGHPGDVLLAISTSGNSVNVIQAAEAARAKNMKVIGLTGRDGGKLGLLCDIEIRAPHSEFADRAQEVHMVVIHALIDCIEQHA
jgi:D-sedoheptulose 7-phosphate isomerase